MGPFFKHATEQNTLKGAWARIRANGIFSPSTETRSQIAHFDQNVEGNIRRVQAELRQGAFRFEPQHGVLKQKSSGKGKRGIVMASVRNRIVERALRDTLQAKSSFIQEVLALPTSVGGVRDRSVPHGLAAIDDAFKAGKLWFARSDISSFFDNIHRDGVINKIAEHVFDPVFLALLAEATTVVLENEAALGDDRACFPIGADGVAQGSPLSPLFGNILLHDFDRLLNGRDIVCVRFIDDFVLLGPSNRKVIKAFASGEAFLADLGLRCHNPYAGADPEKSAHGHASDGFDFLGYRICPTLRFPSARARQKLLAEVDKQFSIGRRAVNACIWENSSLAHRQRPAQTIEMVDRIVKGWGNAFRYGDSKSTRADLDRAIDEKRAHFRAWLARRMQPLSEKQRRLISGITQLVDIPAGKLDELPFRLSAGRKRLRRTSATVTISTDGSVLGNSRRRGRNQGPGGWAFVIHDMDQTASGSCPNATNNQMELLAVVMALRARPENSSTIIRTDSRYVEATFGRFQIVDSHFALWRELERLARTRAVKIDWVRGHAGDPHNVLADELARKAALSLSQNRAELAAA